jgi:[1-hydroxy-2-(trimethylamino)ethyl]phosphonate dioxygenase
LSKAHIVDEILELFARHGAVAYHGECVSQTEHSLQAADLARRDGAANWLIIAALLHDVGHLLDGQEEDFAVRGIDGRHEVAGCAWLTNHFGTEVTEPIRLHVDAKRYLCTVNPDYAAGLSAASRSSLTLQGGLMGADERARFESNPFCHDAVRLRHWDDAAKVHGLRVPSLEHYRTHLEAALKQDCSG